MSERNFPIDEIYALASKNSEGKEVSFGEKKIKVRTGLLNNEAKKIYKPYIYNKNNKLPFVTGKIATSKDNFIHSKNRTKISNEYSHNISHLLRFRNDSILISNRTLNIDNPKLNCRIYGLKNFSPKRIILDRNLSIKKKSYIFQTSNKKNTIIFYKKAMTKKVILLKDSPQDMHLERI